MSTDSFPKLTPLQLSALVILMSEAREITNAELMDMAGFTLTGKDRTGLEALGLTESRKVGRVVAHQLTDKGWRMCKQLGTSTSVTGSRPGRALLVLLTGVHRSLDRAQVSHADFFKQGEMPAPEPAAPAGDVETRIRSVYRDLARVPGDWISLADLRASLADLDRSTVDEALRVLSRQADVQLIPVANSKALDTRDREAALRLGGEDIHALAIGRG
ncbi:hypothetical protein [Luedemannella helvata]|uniref:MarR family transcriptional regulator n=1 Tax=Luedemannella helvata TaxID=349315 RepID=A0ABN2L3N5_9ACTN